ncbi:hypothetical protein APA62_32630 [Pseudomonas aeruginosa]|nr:hypothetical protein APA62_32630 [Pseudomonas aeruginosa]
MLFAPALADRAILPTAWGGRYFFNRIGRKLTLVAGSYGRNRTLQPMSESKLTSQVERQNEVRLRFGHSEFRCLRHVQMAYA